MVRPNQPTEENILDNFSPLGNSRLTAEQSGTKKQVETPQHKEISERDSWITDFEEYFPDLDNFSSLDYSRLIGGQHMAKKQVKTPQLNNNWIKEEEEYSLENDNLLGHSTSTGGTK